LPQKPLPFRKIKKQEMGALKRIKTRPPTNKKGGTEKGGTTRTRSTKYIAERKTNDYYARQLRHLSGDETGPKSLDPTRGGEQRPPRTASRVLGTITSLEGKAPAERVRSS